MTDTLIHCPSCGTEIPVSEVLGAQIRAETEKELQQVQERRLKEAVSRAEQRAREALGLELRDLKEQVREKAGKAEEAAQREIELRKKARELEEQNRNLADKVRSEVEAAVREEAEKRIESEVQRAWKGARDEADLELKALRENVQENEKKVRKAQAAELELRKQTQVLEARARELDLEVARKLDVEKNRLEEQVRKAVGEEQDLKIKEKEKQIDDLRKALAEAKRKSEQGSQETQGEVLELDIQARLEQLFPHDQIRPVPKGIRGADLIHEVRNANMQPCGSMIWETKNTKNWSTAWIEKLKEDQRTVGGSLAVLVSSALPEGVEGFAPVDGVWVADLRAWPALAAVLREQLIQVAFAHAASVGKQEKMELLYRYLAGDQFRQKVQGIVEAFEALQSQLAKERRAMERQWKEREKQIERVITNTVGMYGEMSGILGGTLPSIPALELDGEALENHSGE